MAQRTVGIPGDGLGKRRNPLSLPFRGWVVGLLLAWAAGGCRPAEVPVAPQPDLARLDHLLRLMGQRLALMHEVARWKWNAGKAITDRQRERDLLQAVVEQGRDRGLDPERVRSFFTAQLEAARSVQQADFRRWKARGQNPVAGKSLSVLRRRIDQLNTELIEALAEVGPWLSEPGVQQALPRRAEAILSGDGLAAVRETAIAPLRR
jgi:chorismate mutase